MRVRFAFTVLALVALAGPLVVLRDGGLDATAAPPGWVSLTVPGLAGDSAGAPTAAPVPSPTPAATGNRGLRIYFELEMNTEYSTQTLVGDIRLADLPPVFTQPIKVRGKYRVDDVRSSECEWTQKHIDTMFEATIYWSPDSAELLVGFDWPHWEDWALCPTHPGPQLIAPPYSLEYHADQVFQVYRDPRYFFHYLIPLETTPPGAISTHHVRQNLTGDHTKARLEITLCKPDHTVLICDWPPFGGP